MANSLTALSNDLAAIVERASKYVVGVHGRPRVGSSGVLWKPGVVVTVEHGLRREDELRVTLPDGKTVPAEVTGRDAGTDMAVLKIENSGDSIGAAGDEVPKTGNLIMALGRTRETGANATLGIVSAVADGWNTWRGGRIDRYIRLDLQLFSGSAGGAVVNAEGAFLGIATPALSRIAPLAIPTATIQRITSELLEKGHVARGYLGIGLQPIGLPEHLKTKLKLAQARALIVLSVEDDAPAGKAGVVIGDILVSLDSKPIGDTDDVQVVIGAGSQGRKVLAGIVRGGELREIPLIVGERPRG
jgi:serine protease Do